MILIKYNGKLKKKYRKYNKVEISKNLNGKQWTLTKYNGYREFTQYLQALFEKLTIKNQTSLYYPLSSEIVLERLVDRYIHRLNDRGTSSRNENNVNTLGTSYQCVKNARIHCVANSTEQKQLWDSPGRLQTKNSMTYTHDLNTCKIYFDWCGVVYLCSLYVSCWQ